MLSRLNALTLAVLVGTNVAACSRPLSSDGSVYTLYRSSVLDAGARLHVATFDSNDGEAYNRENCEAFRLLAQSQDGVTTHFWCEAGRVRRAGMSK